jgi:hypothetical protein
MITCHNFGRHLGCYSIKEVKSQNIDKLTAQGIRFANMFSTTPVCSPAIEQGLSYRIAPPPAKCSPEAVAQSQNHEIRYASN